METDLIPLTSIVKNPDGFRFLVASVMFTGGERYYMLRDPDGDVSMMPAIEVEQWERG